MPRPTLARPKVNRLTRRIAEYLDDLREANRATPHTLVSYETDLRHLASWLHEAGELPAEQGWEKVTHLHLRRYTAHLARDYARSSQVRKLSSLRGFFKWLERRKIIKSNPVARLAAIKCEVTAPDVLSIAEVETLLAAPDLLSAKGKRDRALMEVLYATGMRAAECAALTLNDVDWRRSEIRMREPNSPATRMSRALPLGRPAVQALRDYVQNGRPELVGYRRAKNEDSGNAHSETDALWLSRRGAPMSQVALYLAVRDCARRAKLNRDVSPHTLRHSCAAHLLQNGADELMVGELLGHRTPGVVRRYMNSATSSRW